MSLVPSQVEEAPMPGSFNDGLSFMASALHDSAILTLGCNLVAVWDEFEGA